MPIVTEVLKEALEVKHKSGHLWDPIFIAGVADV